MDCKKVESLISEYSIGLIDGRLKAEIEEHLSICRSCASELEKLNRVMLMVDDLDEIEPPVGLWNGVYNRITQPQEPESLWDKFRAFKHRRAVGWSVGMAAAVLTITMIFTNTNGPQNADVYASDEYSQRHIMYANTDLFADQAALNSIAAISYRENAGGDNL